MIVLFMTLMFHPGTDSLKIFRAPDVVVTSTRSEIDPVTSPSKVVSIDAKQLGTLGFDDLGSILSSAGGLFVKDYGPSQLSTISIRGTGAEETLFMIDGVRINSVQNGLADLFLFPVSELGKIEIGEGGSSSLFGADAIGGVVSLTTETGTTSRASARLTTGSYGFQQGRLDVNEILGPVTVSLSAGKMRARDNFGFDFSDGRNSYPMERTGADFVTDNELAKITIQGQDNSTSIVLSNVTANRGTPGPVTGPFYVGTEREYDGDFFAVISHKRRVGDFDISSSAGFTYGYLRYVSPPAVTGGYYIDDYYKMLSLQPSVQANYVSRNFDFAAGVDAESDRGTSSEMSGPRDRTRAGVFASGDVTLAGPWSSEIHLSPSARLDWYSDFGASANPKFGLNVRPLASLPVNIRASVGTSFRAPTFNELYYSAVGNQSLKPEKSVNFDAGLVISIESPMKVDAEADVYSTTIADGIVWVPSTGSLWRPENYSKILARGIELSGKANYNDLAALNVNYSFGESLDQSDPMSPTYQKQLVYLPEEQASVIAAISPWIFTISGTMRYMGFRYITPVNDQFLPSVVTFDFSAGAKIALSKFVLSPLLAVKNALNENYQVIPQYPMPERTFYFSLGVQFNQ